MERKGDKRHQISNSWKAQEFDILKGDANILVLKVTGGYQWREFCQDTYGFEHYYDPYFMHLSIEYDYKCDTTPIKLDDPISLIITGEHHEAFVEDWQPEE